MAAYQLKMYQTVSNRGLWWYLVDTIELLNPSPLVDTSDFTHDAVPLPKFSQQKSIDQQSAWKAG